MNCKHRRHERRPQASDHAGDAGGMWRRGFGAVLERFIAAEHVCHPPSTPSGWQPAAWPAHRPSWLGRYDCIECGQVWYETGGAPKLTLV